jgi:alkyldihydroxyacetonephosphate synthase
VLTIDFIAEEHRMSDNTRSHWAWGHASRFPDPEARQNLAEQVSALLRFPALQIEDPCPPEQLRLHAPRSRAPASLAAIASTDPLDRARHTYGRGYPDLRRGFEGDFGPAPDLVLYPRDEAEVERCLAEAAQADVALVPYGGGTSVVGGVECDGRGYAGVWCLDMGRMNRLLQLDEVDRCARFEAGVTGPHLEEQLRPHGLTLRHYPQSFEFSTLGGWIATRAGGHYSTIYTHIDDLVQSIEAIAPSGRWSARRFPASGAGPDPNRLLLGSEGRLGVITSAWMRLRVRPERRASVCLSFEDWEEATASVRAIAQSGLHPTTCRLLDRREAMLHGVSMDGDHVLLLGFEGSTTAVDVCLREAVLRCSGFAYKSGPHFGDGAQSSGPAGTWREAFMAAPYLYSSLVSMGLVVDTFETACTWSALPALHERVVAATRAALRERCGQGLVSCRFTHVYPDGPAVYYTFIGPGRPGEQLQQWRAVKEAATRALQEAGGTITHHHAVGRLHRSAYEAERPDAFAAALEAARQSLDPQGILNPGALLPSPRGG